MLNTDGQCYKLGVRVGLLTICLRGLPGFSLQSLSEKLLLFGQVLLYKAVLTHLLPNLRYTHRKNTLKLRTSPSPYTDEIDAQLYYS